MNADGSQQRNLTRTRGGKESGLVWSPAEETVSVSAPPRPPRPSDPVDRESSRPCRGADRGGAAARTPPTAIYAASVALVALVVVAVSASPAHGTVADSSSAFARGSAFPPERQVPKLAFISGKHYACCGQGGPFQLYVMNADGSGKRLLTRACVGGTRLVARWAEDRLRRRHPRRQGRDLRHECRRERAAERDAHRGIRVLSCLVARWAEDRLQPRPERGPAGVRHQRRRERTAAADGPRGEQRTSCLVARREDHLS